MIKEIPMQDMLPVAQSLPKFDKSVSCLCWAYNEALLIEGFLLRLNKVLSETISDYEIVVVDDCSTDGTLDIIKALQKRIPQISLFRNRINRNVGVSFQRAIRAAKKEYLFWQTIDWSYDLKNLRLYLELLREYDVVAGSRGAPILRSWPWKKRLAHYLKIFSPMHLKKRSDTVSKALVSIVNYFLVRLLFQVPITDYQNIAIFPTKLIKSFKYESRSSFSNPEGLIKAYWQGARIAEVPISFIPRSAGLAKGTKPRAILAAVSNIFKLWFRWIVLRRRDFRSRGKVTRIDIGTL